MKPVLLIAVLTSIAAAQNTPVFPGRVATNQDLLIGTNNAATALAATIGTGDTVIPVGDGSVFTAPLVVSIDKEIISICAVVGNNLSVGKSSCPNADGRGFESTSAASHTIKATVQGRITAWLHNQMAAEMIATESKVNQVVSVKDFKAKGDGSDDTVAIQGAVNAVCSTGGIVMFPPPASFYGLALGGIQVVGCNNITFLGNQGSIIRVIAGAPDTPHNSWPNYGLNSILRIVRSSNITVEGLTLDGSLPNRTANLSGESFDSNILIAASTNIRIHNSNLLNGMTDCITVVPDSTPTINTNIWIERNTLANCRRNNISATAQNGLYITDNVISGAGTIQGTPPMSGIDIEPDNLSAPSTNVQVSGDTVTGSAGTYAESYGGFGTNGLTVTNEHVHDNAALGINFDSADSVHFNQHSILSNSNIYSQTAGAGVRIVGKSLDLMSGNLVNGNLTAVATFSPDGLVIEGGTMADNLNQAIFNDPSYPFIRLSINHVEFRDDFSNIGLGNSASGAAFIGTCASSTSLLTVNDTLIYGTQSPVTDTSPSGLKISGSCQARGNGNTAFGMNNSPPKSQTLTFGGILGSGNHNYDLTSGLIRFADSATGGADFSANNGGGPLYVTERQVNVTNTNTIPVTVCNVGDMAWNGVPASGQPRGWYCAVGNTWTSMGNLP